MKEVERRMGGNEWERVCNSEKWVADQVELPDENFILKMYDGKFEIAAMAPYNRSEYYHESLSDLAETVLVNFDTQEEVPDMPLAIGDLALNTRDSGLSLAPSKDPSTATSIRDLLSQLSSRLEAVLPRKGNNVDSWQSTFENFLKAVAERRRDRVQLWISTNTMDFFGNEEVERLQLEGDALLGKHKCNSPQHNCKMSCSLETCNNPCAIAVELDHERHQCHEIYCPRACIINDCSRTWGVKDHFHGLDDPNAEHLCGSEHACPEKCQEPGICEILTELLRQTRFFEGKRGCFQYEHVSEQNGLRPAERFVDPCSKEKGQEFGLCNHYCKSEDHNAETKDSTKSYCTEQLWHKPITRTGQQGNSAGLGCVYEAILRFIQARLRTVCEDSISVVLFDKAATIAVEKQTMEEGVINCLLQYRAAGEPPIRLAWMPQRN
ncbi:hypothetical protein KI387_033368 [Taxus chinensis]|uniref:Uncharacterized protein n=1 Tax=Taxus chinensis TaxID=29808 RepID=A0AA38BS79_TAXCH|nr:hypothetical protein KI387_033368 [Taxus chinensis]